MSNVPRQAGPVMSQQTDRRSSVQTPRTVIATRLQPRFGARRNLKTDGGGTQIAINLGIFLGVVLVLGVALLLFEQAIATRINPHVSVAGIAMGGVALDDAQTFLNQRLAAQDQDPVRISVAQQTVTVTAAQFHPRHAARAALYQASAWGHETNLLTRLWNQLQAIVVGRDFPATTSYDQRAVQQYLLALNRTIAVAPVSARVGIAGGTVAIVRHASSGLALDLPSATQVLSQALDSRQTVTISLPVQSPPPLISNDQAQLVVNEAQALLSKPMYFSSVSRVRAWYITPAQMLNLFTFKTVSQPGGALAIVLGINLARLRVALAPIAAAIDHPPIPATYMVAVGEGGQPDSAVPEPDGPGLAIDVNKTAQAILNAATTHSVIIPLVHPHATFDLNAARAMGFDTELASASMTLNGVPPDRLVEAKKAAALVSNTRLSPGQSLSLKALLYPRTKPDRLHATPAGLATSNGGATLVATALYDAAYGAGLTINARTAVSDAIAAQSIPGGDALVGKGPDTPDLVFTNNTAAFVLINVVAYQDSIAAYLFTQNSVHRTVSVSSPTVILNQDGTIVVTENRAISGDIQKQDSSTTTYRPLDSYR
jgi:vancomycin resistance protein YoaR